MNYEPSILEPVAAVLGMIVFIGIPVAMIGFAVEVLKEKEKEKGAKT